MTHTCYLSTSEVEAGGYKIEAIHVYTVRLRHKTHPPEENSQITN